MIPDLTDEGLLPIGRFQCTMDEVEAVFVKGQRFAGSATREDVWMGIHAFLAEMADLRARIPATFLGGSFTTGKLDPDDGDLSPLIDMSRIQSDTTRRVVLETVKAAKSNLKLDVFPIRWRPEDISLTPVVRTQAVQEYLLDRGQWDDFWQRRVAREDRSAFVRTHAFPARGYLEVIIDGYR